VRKKLTEAAIADAAAVWNLLMNQPAELGEVQRQKDQGSGQDGKNQQNP